MLALCTRCGQCMKTCPTNVLQPSLSKSGVMGVFTPEMDYRTGYCEWSCAECGKVCPTGAIKPLELAEKREPGHRPRVHRPEPVHPVGRRQEAASCARSCARSPDKAIALEDVTIPTASGRR